jgi:lysophospholipase L1-like esterase
VDISDPGDTIAQQRSALALLSVQRDTAAYAMLQIGLNDLTPGESAAVALARLQALVGDFRAKVGRWTPIFLSQMIPCRSRLISIYGGTNGPIAYQKWLDMNQAIAGLGATPITGVDARITAHVALMNDGSGNLKPIYDTGDGIHPNNAGRQINVDAWQAALLSYGLTA